MPAPDPWQSLDLQVTGARSLAGAGTHWEGAALPVRRSLRVVFGPLPAVPSAAEARCCQIMERSISVRLAQNELWIDQRLYLKVGGRDCTLICADPSVPPDVLALVFTEVHRAGGWLPLHAAVVARAGQAVAVTGPSGAGKSTALLQLLQLGFGVVAEDRAFWHAPTGQVAGLDRHLRVYRASLARFAPARLRLPSLERDVKGKYLLPLPAGTTGHLLHLLLLGQEQALPPAARVRAAWELTGVPLAVLGRQAVQAGLPGLLSLIHPVGVPRENVVRQVTDALGKSD